MSHNSHWLKFWAVWNSIHMDFKLLKYLHILYVKNISWRFLIAISWVKIAISKGIHICIHFLKNKICLWMVISFLNRSITSMNLIPVGWIIPKSANFSVFHVQFNTNQLCLNSRYRRIKSQVTHMKHKSSWGKKNLLGKNILLQVYWPIVDIHSFYH